MMRDWLIERLGGVLSYHYEFVKDDCAILQRAIDRKNDEIAGLNDRIDYWRNEWSETHRALHDLKEKLRELVDA